MVNIERMVTLKGCSLIETYFNPISEENFGSKGNGQLGEGGDWEFSLVVSDFLI